MSATALLLSLALFAPGAASPPGAPPPPAGTPAAAERDVRARVRALLGAIDRPVSAEAFRRLGPGVDGALAELARSEDDHPAFRARALAVLAALRGEGAEEVHRRLAADAAAPGAVRRAAARGLATLLPPPRAAAELRPLLEADADPGVRAAVAEALAQAAPAEGCAAVRRQAARETGPRAAAFARAVATCDGPGGRAAPGR